MFKTSTFVGFILFFIGLFFWLWHFCSLHKLDYNHLTQDHFEESKKADPVALSIYQTRNDLVRQLYTSHGDFLLETYIQADHSLLQLVPDGGRIELLERLENLFVASQEKIQVKNTAIRQTIDYLQAQGATWRHKTETLIADQGSFSVLETQGSKLPSMKILSKITPILRTELDHARLWFEEGKPHLDAEGVAASLQNL